MKEKESKFIVIEGLDGCGKSTQTMLLIERLESEGHKCKFIHFPILEQGVYGNLIARFLRGELGKMEEVHPALVALIYACERKEHSHILQSWLNDGYTVITDRYVYSNIAYQCAKLSNNTEKMKLRNWIIDLEFNVNALPQPDKVLFLDAPKRYIKNAMLNERDGADRCYLHGEKDIHEADDTFQSRVYDEYLKMIGSIDDFTAIKCYNDIGLYSIDEIHERIYEEIQ